MKQVSAFVHNTIKALVDNPDEVEINETVGKRTIVFNIKAPDEMGRIIGRNGQNIEAIRTIATALARKENPQTRVLLEVVD